MEITKGENANLAGMEPRCPKCGNGLCVIVDTDPNDYQCFAVAISCQDGSCQYKVFPGWDAKDFLPFFRSPAPTPPLDVEARELEEAWSMLVERGVRIYTLSTALIDRDAYARTERAITQLLSLLRRHITSPAQPEKRDEVKACEVCDETEMLTVMGRNQYACPKHRAVAPQSGKEGQ